MPATYLETIQKLQQQGLATLKQAQTMQLASLASFRDIVAAAPAVTEIPAFDKLPSFGDLAEIGTAFTKQLLEQQNAYLSELSGVFASAQKDAAAAADRVAQAAPKTV